MSEHDKQEVQMDLKEIQKPLLDGSPKASVEGSDELNIPDSKVHPRMEDSNSARTGADLTSPSKTTFQKSQAQAAMDSFLIYFGESAGLRQNERSDGPNGRPVDEESELSDMQASKYVPQGQKPKTSESLQKMLVSFNAPDDATKCVKVESLSSYIKNEAKLIKNPRRSYFELSRRYYKAKYPDGNNKRVLEVESFLQTTDGKNYLKNMSLDIIQTQQGNIPVVKTYEENAYDDRNFVKAIKFFDYNKDDKKIKQFKTDDGVMDDAYRTYDISTLHFQNSVLFYVRYEKWLQLHRYDVIEKKDEQVMGYQIEMPHAQDIRYHPIFSQEFGQKQRNIQEKSAKTQTLKEFLDQQFVFCQEYKISDKQTYETKGLKMFSMQNTAVPIEQYGGKMEDLKEAIQKIAHIKRTNEQGSFYTFVAIDPFSTHIFGCPENLELHEKPVIYTGNNEYQLQHISDLNDPNHDSQWKYENMAPFLIHENPQFLIQKDLVSIWSTEDNDYVEVDQYYYMTNDSQFMLVYPNYKEHNQKCDVIFQLAKKHSYIIVNYEDYEYMDDFLQRRKDYEVCNYKKIAHVAHDSYRSKNYMKRSEHLREIIEYPKPFQMNHRLILSTDQARSNIYVYMSNIEEKIGKNIIEIFKYENNIDKSVSLRPKPLRAMHDDDEEVHQIPKLPKQVQDVMHEDARFNKKKSTKELEEEANCYYLNGNFKNVVSSKYCVKTQSQSLVDKQCHQHFLQPAEAKYFCIVEGTKSNSAQYLNIRLKHETTKEDVQLQLYYRSKQYYVFLFKLVTQSPKTKHTFFFVRMTNAKVEELGQNNGMSLISNDQDIYMVTENDLLGSEEQVYSKYIKQAKFNELVQLHTDSSEKHPNIHLTVETLLDNRKRYEFLPFIYQEKKAIASHNLLILDINSMSIYGKQSINSNLAIRQYLRKSTAGYAMYTLTRTSDTFDQKIGFIDRVRGRNADACSQVGKYQITHQYLVDDGEDSKNPAKCTLEFSEFLVHFKNQNSTASDIKLIGRKQMLLSDVAQFRREQTFDKLFILPYFDQHGKIKGSQLILKEDDQVIKIVDQDKNRIFHQETDLLQFGQQKFLTDSHSHDEYLLLVSAQLKQRVYMKGNLDTSESYYILNKIQKKIMSMQLAKFEYFVLTDDFDKLMREEFYQAQEVLQGKTICDICLNFPKEIAQGLRLEEKNFSQIDGSLIDELCFGEKHLIDFYKKIGLCEDNLMIQADFNFVTTLRLAIELGANQSVKLLLNKIFELNRAAYKEILMLDLPKLLEDDLLERIYPFLERDHEEKSMIKDDQESMHTAAKANQAQFCNFEDFIINPDLPPFSKEQVSYHVMSDFIDYHNAEQELLCEVILKDPSMIVDAAKEDIKSKGKKKYEVEHSFINFEKLIIGEKIRGYQEDFRNIEFNDQHLAQLLHKEDEDKLDFYELETVQKLIDFQFYKTKAFLNLIIKLYICGFLAPFILSITIDNFLIQNLCYIFCFVTQCFLIFFELVQMNQYRLEYFKDFWNIVDLFQFIGFMYLYFHKLSTQFGSDSFPEILFSALILFLSVYKMMYFVRIYDKANETLTIIYAITTDLIPFGVLTLALIFSLSKIYQVLHMGVNDPQGLYSQINSGLIKLFMQTIKTSTGDKTPPSLDPIMSTRLNTSPFLRAVFIFFLEVVWGLQIVLSSVFSLFAISKAMSSYEKIMQKLDLLILQSKAKFNEENFQILNLLQKQHNFKVIFFQLDKDLRNNQDKKFEGSTRALEKQLIESENRKLDMKKDEDKQRLHLREIQEKTLKVIGDLNKQLNQNNSNSFQS